MYIWLDIDNPKHVPFYKVFITVLKDKGHEVVVTALGTKEIKKALSQHKLEAKVFGKIFSVFGLFEKFFQMYRAVLLNKYITSKEINLAFSLGSKSMLTTCAYRNLPLTILLYSPMQKVHSYHFGFKKSYYIISDSIAEELITNYGISLNRIRKHKGVGNEEAPYTTYQSLTEIYDQLKELSNCIDNEINA